LLETIRQGVELQIRNSATDIDIRWRQLEVARRARELLLAAQVVERCVEGEPDREVGDAGGRADATADAGASEMTNLQNAELQLETIRQGVELQIRNSATDIDIRWRQRTRADRSPGREPGSWRSARP
jgi:hypothetical protein